MKVFFIVSLLWSMVVLAQTPAPVPEKPAVLMTGYGDLHHPVSTQNAEAQQFFDQGLRLIYAFNHDEALRSFRRATELDPKLAMAWWGVALAIGPNYNLPVDSEHEKIAADAVAKATVLSLNAPEVEKDYIRAMAVRFSSGPNPNYRQLDIDYSKAMRELARKYPDDLDAATLFADSMMNLHPWKLWNTDGTPVDGTAEIVTTLESALRRDPNHIGAMHFYIHTVEASPSPQRALPYADRLAALTPAAGHLVHMPSHIYINTGNYNGGRLANEDAAKADERYIAATGAQGVYPLMYYSHNLHFLAIAAATQGRCADAQDAAKKLAANVHPATGEMPMLEAFEGIQLMMAVRCEQWNELLQMTPPDARTPTLKGFWLYSRGSALAATGKVSEAEAMQTQLAAVVKQVPRDEIFMPPVENKTWQILHIADDVLAARIAAVKGDKVAAMTLLRDAVANQDELKYNEPPDWYYEVRESLGGQLLQTGDAKGAEQVFRYDLARHPRNPRSLFGLAEALKMQGRTYDASWVVTQFQTAWQGADVKLTVDTL